MRTEHGKRIRKWKVLGSKVAFRNHWWDIREEKVLLPNGNTTLFYVNRSLGGVLIFPVTEEGKVVLVRQYKHGAGRILLELPVGRVEPRDRDLRAAAVRELREETGYAPGKIRLLDTFELFPTSSTVKMRVYLATGCRKVGEPLDTEKEITDTVLVTPKELAAMLRKGGIASLFHVGAAYLALDELGII